MLEGAQIGQYRVLRKIGEGGMGAVFLAQHVLIGRRAAIKVLLPALSQQHAIVERFFNEARATTAIPDPGIVQVFDFGFAADQSAYIVMEFLEGEPLDQRLKRLGLLAPSDALRITRQAAGSLAAAHARNIVHRDLKPDNLFMVRDPEAASGERPKILDFGIAKLGGDEPGRMRTRTGTVMGTPVYMSPEQCRGSGELDHRSDIYSLGCVLFHLVTGRPPFDMEGMGEILSAHLREPPRPPSALTLGIPPDLDALVLQCLAKAPADRFQTMGELQRACDALLARITANGAGAAPLALATPFAPGFRSVSPGASAAVVATTTLGSASGQPMTSGGKRTALFGGLAALVTGGAIAIAVAARGSGTGATPAAPAAPTAAPIAAVPPDAAPIAAAPPDAAPIAAAAPPDAALAPPVIPKPAGAPSKRRAASTRATRSEDLYDDR
ncbi:MAG: serine/threonine protein kinase [Deltaproteobacteria bacterium]|nr:serine/threonine protein kinase [Deltaproteobacteria bacterium]